jgi:hypothetical protein
MASSSLYVQVTYRIPLTSKEEGTKEESFEKEEEHSKIFADAPPARLGLPPGVQPCKVRTTLPAVCTHWSIIHPDSPTNSLSIYVFIINFYFFLWILHI